MLEISRADGTHHGGHRGFGGMRDNELLCNPLPSQTHLRSILPKEKQCLKATNINIQYGGSGAQGRCLSQV